MAQTVKDDIVHAKQGQIIKSEWHPTTDDYLGRIADALEYIAMAESVKLKDYGIPPFAKK